jgi:peptide/nickel transport system permease protein
MLQYIFKRLIYFVPTFIAISLVTFLISINTPGDPIENMLNQNMGGEGRSGEKIATEQAYVELRHQLGFDLPLFYFTLTNKTYSDTLYRVPKKTHRDVLARLSYKYGNWADVATYYRNIRKFEFALYKVDITEKTSEDLRKLKDMTNSLYLEYRENVVNNIINQIETILNKNKSIKNSVNPYFLALKNSILRVIQNQNIVNRYIPVIYWYGLNNQYHRWLSNFLTGNFGISYQDKRPVTSVLYDAIKWSMLLSVLSIIIAYLVAIPLGVTSAVKKGTKTEKIITTALFLLYSLPNFWVATMLIMFFGGGDYLDIFPSFGLGSLSEDAPFWDRFIETAYHIILPLFCLTYASFAFISRQMRGGMLNVLDMDYIRTARAKGLSQKVIIWKHAFRNSLIPIITLFASIFPAAIAGSFVIENIFSIPGMGQLMLKALFARDYPIVFTVFMFSAILTMVGNLVADILYAVVDPRISYK